MVNIEQMLISFIDDCGADTGDLELFYEPGDYSFRDVIESARESTKIVCLSLFNTPIREIDFSILRMIPTIETVCIMKCTFFENDASLSTLPSLESLSIQSCDGTFNLLFIENQAQSLQNLDVTDVKVSCTTALASMQKLHFLKLPLPEPENSQELWRIKSLKMLSVYSEGTVTDILPLKKIDGLRRLTVSGPAKNFLAIIALPHLKCLFLTTSNVSIIEAIIIQAWMRRCYIRFPWSDRLLFSELISVCALILSPVVIIAVYAQRFLTSCYTSSERRHI